MQKIDRSLHLRSRTFLRADNCDVADLAAICEVATDVTDYPLAATAEKGVLIYGCPTLAPRLSDPDFADALMAEWADALANGPGVIVLSGAEPDLAMIDRASAIFRELIARQNAAGTGGGDHFAKPGANDRLWNSLEKHCLADPVNFARYYANPFLALVSQAWLGPYYQMTAQLNVVNPGGASQSPHRDYHLGFQSADAVARYPSHVHRFSPMLTLQGAIAHVDATIEAGPTLLLPHSQKYEPGYLATAVCQIRGRGSIGYHGGGFPKNIASPFKPLRISARRGLGLDVDFRALVCVSGTCGKRGFNPFVRRFFDNGLNFSGVFARYCFRGAGRGFGHFG